MENYIPKIHENGKYIEMLIEAKICNCCGKSMIDKFGFNKIFPAYYKINQDAQMKNAGLVYSSNILVDNKPICSECVKSNKADFLCQLCGERKPTDKIEESFGDPAEFLCRDCYETKPAKIWDAKCDELREKHRYDFE